MISIIITSYKEASTIGKAIESFTNQNISDYKLLVLTPDKETKDVVLKYVKNNKKIKYVQDPGKGKPTALNIALKKAKGDILILSDGDVFVSETSVNELLKKIKGNVGAVSGRPISLNSRNNMFGYWSHLLTDAAHEARSKEKIIECSGYLYAIKNVIKNIPENILVDDGYISHLICKKYKIGYAPNAKVYVKYPNNFKDWILQKKRSAGGYIQIKKYFKNSRGFGKESSGIFFALSYAKNLKEFYYTFILIFARLYLWFKILVDIKLRKQRFGEIWKRVESSK